MFFTSGMVLQRNATTVISGGAPAGSVVTISFCQKQYEAAASDSGKWRIAVSCGEACGPKTMNISCSNGEKLDLADVYVGEVWLCSGQSNMQLPMDRLRYKFPQEMTAPKNDKIRMFTVPIKVRYSSSSVATNGVLDEGSEIDCSGGAVPAWQAASSETIASFSGSAYFFAKNLAEKLGVTVGIILAAQGGSPVTSWMGEKSLEAFPDYAAQRKKFLDSSYCDELKKRIEAGLERWNKLCNESDIGTPQKWHEKPFDNEKTLNLPGSLAEKSFAGVIWLQKEVELTAAQLSAFKKHGAWLWLGTIVDLDFVWVNGTKVGTTWYLYPPRRYQIDPNLLHEGKNRIAVRVVSSGRSGGAKFIPLRPYALFSGDIISGTDWQQVFDTGAITKVYKPELLKEKLAAGGVCISLEGEWQSRIGCAIEPRSDEHFFEWEPSALYYGMLEQCFDYAVKGAVWYQGESNAEKYSEYSDLLVAMAKDWREHFVHCPEKLMPFIIAELPCFNDINLLTDKCDWAFLREQQHDAATKLENAAVATLIDCGEWNELHPEDKATVGRRCAEQALRLGYGDAEAPVAPEAAHFSLKGNAVIIEIDCGKDELVCRTSEISGFTALIKQDNESKVVPLKAKLLGGNKIEVDLKAALEAGAELFELRYLFVDCPPEVCLFSKNGSVPLKPFRKSFKDI